MVENNRKPIASLNMFPQFTTMNVIDGQAGVIIYSSLICHSVTIDNILNIVVLLILAGVTIATLTGDNGLLQKAGEAKQTSEKATLEEKAKLAYIEYELETRSNSNANELDTMTNALRKAFNDNSIEVTEVGNSF